MTTGKVNTSKCVDEENPGALCGAPGSLFMGDKEWD